MADRNVVIVAGGGAIHAGVAPVLRDIADRTNIGVLNTWTAKGLFPWNHPAHLGTIGLQAGDLELSGLRDVDDVVLCGADDDELPRAELDRLGVHWREVPPSDIADERFEIRTEPSPRPPLYGALAAVCQPLYADESTPLNPARAASDLATMLPDGGVVCADASRSGFWIARTLPTRALGSVQLPSRPTPGFAAMQASMARRSNRFSVAVVDAVDAATEQVMDRAVDLVVEVWTDALGGAPNSTTGSTPNSAANDRAAGHTTSDDRAERIRAAHAAGGVQVLYVDVRFDAIDALVAVAGAPRWHP